MKERNKNVQDLKGKIKGIKKTQTEETSEMENLWKRTGTTDARITSENRSWKQECPA